MLISGIALMYLALYHPYWVRGGDSELYLAIARHLVRGEGYRYNGQPVGLVPPGWPLLLAGGMWLTSNIALLKLMLLGSMLIFFGSAFHVLRRYATPWSAAAAVLMVAICQPTWQLTMWFLAEAPFLAASWLALLLAVQAREHSEDGGRAWGFWWRLLAALSLLAVSISIRWTGLLWAAMLALALVDGRPMARLGLRGWLELRLWPQRFDRLWVAAGLCLLVGLVTFFALRQSMRVDPTLLDPRYSTFEAGEYDLINQTGSPTVGTYVERLLSLPHWVGVLFWNLLARVRSLQQVMAFIALLSLGLICCGALVGIARRQWLWLGAAAVWLPVILTWPSAIARYVMPVAPFLPLAAILGVATITRWLNMPANGRWRYPVLAGAIALLLWSVTWYIGRLAINAVADDVAPNYFQPVAEAIPALPLLEARSSFIALATFTVLTVLVMLSAASRGHAPSADGSARLPWLLRMTPIWMIAPAAVIAVLWNAALFGLEAWAAHDPVNRYEAGSQRELISIGHYLRGDLEAGSGELAVAAVRAYNDRRYSTLGPRRKTVWLADRPAIDVAHTLAHEPGKPPGLDRARPPSAPTTSTEDELDPALVQWLRQRNVRWYVSTMMQYRLLHLSRPSPRADSDNWRLYEITPAGVRRVDATGQPQGVLVVPGLEDVTRVAGGRARLPIPYN